MRAVNPATYPVAVALVVAGVHNDVASFEAILAETEPGQATELVRALVDLCAGVLVLLADASGEPFDTVTGRVGTFAAKVAEGTLRP